jgi:hypothetical protein
MPKAGTAPGRLIVPWDDALTPIVRPGWADDWVREVRAAGMEPMISFEHSLEDRCPAAPCTAPSLEDYRRSFRLFRLRNPEVTTFSPWNEANHHTQPTAGRRRSHLVA